MQIEYVFAVMFVLFGALLSPKPGFVFGLICGWMSLIFVWRAVEKNGRSK